MYFYQIFSINRIRPGPPGCGDGRARAQRLGRAWSGLGWWLALALGLAAPAAFGQATATATFDPPQLPAGAVGEYRLELNGTSGTPSGTVPQVAGLTMANPSRASRINIINGSISQSMDFTWQVQASQPGRLTVPAFTIQVNGQDISVPAATIEILPGNALPAAPGNPGAPGAGPAGNPANGTAPIALKATPSRTEVYVGERFPLDLVLSVGADLGGLHVNGFDQNGDAFEQVKLPQDAARSSGTQDGRAYDVFTWHAATTALKAGNQTLQFTMPVVVSMPGGMDPFFADFFQQFGGGVPMGFGRDEQLTLQAPTLAFNVQPLPTDGKPGNFTGGIGLFSVDEPELSAKALQVGVPVTLKVTVSGEGNFDRFQAPALDLGALWRTYTPRATFTALDPSSYHGKKIFEYTLIPLSDKITEVPPPQVNYFNPETKAYIDLTPKPVPVTVQPAPPGQAPAPLPVVPTPAAVVATPALVPPRTTLGRLDSLQFAPLYASPWFWAAQVLPAGMLAGWVVSRRRQLRLENDPAYARRQRARRSAQAAVARARAAAGANQPAEFYALAQRALQEGASYSAAWTHNEAGAVTWPEFDAHLAAVRAAPDFRQQVREIFEAGDALRFGGFQPDRAALADAAARLEKLVRQLLLHT